jgi:carbamoylphosphate synthase small subunit
MCQKTISELKKVINAEGDLLKPVFGICLGNQLLALAAGAKTVKLPFGNRYNMIITINFHLKEKLNYFDFFLFAEDKISQ